MEENEALAQENQKNKFEVERLIIQNKNKTQELKEKEEASIKREKQLKDLIKEHEITIKTHEQKYQNTQDEKQTKGQ